MKGEVGPHGSAPETLVTSILSPSDPRQQSPFPCSETFKSASTHDGRMVGRSDSSVSLESHAVHPVCGRRIRRCGRPVIAEANWSFALPTPITLQQQLDAEGQEHRSALEVVEVTLIIDMGDMPAMEMAEPPGKRRADPEGQRTASNPLIV
jgi:hypothetical protein